MKILITLLFSILLFEFSFSQINIQKPENFNKVDSIEAAYKIDSINSLVKSDLKTSNNQNTTKILQFNLQAMRAETKVILNLSLKQGTPPNNIIIERKSSAPLSEYRTIKVLSQSEIQALIDEKQFIFDDNFPESRQLDSYYRVKYEVNEGMMKMTPGILLLGQNASNTLILQNQKIDSSHFISSSDKAIIEEKSNDYGVKLTIVRNVTSNEIYIKGSEYLQADQQIYLERQTSEYLASFRKFKDLSAEEIETLLTKGELLIIDKYPPSSKLTCYYRLVVQHPNKDIKEFPAVELPALRAK
jgi:hypothetical protein